MSDQRPRITKIQSPKPYEWNITYQQGVQMANTQKLFNDFIGECVRSLSEDYNWMKRNIIGVPSAKQLCTETVNAPISCGPMVLSMLRF